jgi:hypothetical protein
MVSISLQPFYPWGRNPQCPLGGRLCSPESQSGCHGEEKNPVHDMNKILIIMYIEYLYGENNAYTGVGSLSNNTVPAPRFVDSAT